MANIKLNLPGEPFTTQIVTFTAPCNCSEVSDGLSINGEIYTVCDAMGECVTGKGGAWCAGAQISVVLDCENKKAFIQNAASPNLKDALNAHINNQNNPHNVTAEQVMVTENVVNAIKETGNWSVDGILTQLGNTMFGGETLYRWMKKKTGLVLQTGNTAFSANSGAGFTHTIYCSKEVAINEDGTITLVNPTTIQVQAPGYALPSSATIPEGYCIHGATSHSMVWESDGTATATVSYTGAIYGFSIYPVNLYKVGVLSELLTSTDPNAHYDGEVDEEGYTYTALDPITAFVPRIQTFSYVGTGTYGQNNPTTWTFAFPPKLIFVADTSTGSYNCWATTDLLTTTSFTRFMYMNSAWASAKKSEDGKTISLYAANAASQANDATNKFIIAIG